MKRIGYFELISQISEFKTLTTPDGDELVVFKNLPIQDVDFVDDKTEFESSENHVHLLDNIKKDEFDRLIPVAQNLGKMLLGNLKYSYPDKQFMVYVSLMLKDSMIIRFHQVWENEVPFCNPESFVGDREKVFMFRA